MNPQENRDYERRLQELETELDKDRIPTVDNQLGQPLLTRRVNQSQPEKSVLSQVANWFNRLPSGGKVAVGIVAAVVGFAILRSVLQLVASLISLAILGVILYLVYKFFVTSKSSK
jgi:hypothetical protein